MTLAKNLINMTLELHQVSEVNIKPLNHGGGGRFKGGGVVDSIWGVLAQKVKIYVGNRDNPFISGHLTNDRTTKQTKLALANESPRYSTISVAKQCNLLNCNRLDTPTKYL